jgi:hypothetical protein
MAHIKTIETYGWVSAVGIIPTFLTQKLKELAAVPSHEVHRLRRRSRPRLIQCASQPAILSSDAEGIGVDLCLIQDT